MARKDEADQLPHGWRMSNTEQEWDYTKPLGCRIVPVVTSASQRDSWLDDDDDVIRSALAIVCSLWEYDLSKKFNKSQFNQNLNLAPVN